MNSEEENVTMNFVNLKHAIAYMAETDAGLKTRVSGAFHWLEHVKIEQPVSSDWERELELALKIFSTSNSQDPIDPFERMDEETVQELADHIVRAFDARFKN